MKLNREQIVKALECCMESAYCATCRATNYCDGMDDLMKNAFALIRELTEENERLSRTRYMVTPDGRTEMIPSVESVKVNTVRKMQERLKADMHNVGRVEFNGILYYCISDKFVDKIAKEMLEEE